MFDLDDDNGGSVTGGSKDLDWLAGIDVTRISKACEKKFRTYRLFGPGVLVFQHDLKWISSKTGKETGYSKLCPRTNVDTSMQDRVWPPGHPNAGQLVPCKACELGMKAKKRFYMHAIDREKQRMGMPNPVTVLDIPQTVMISIYAKKEHNVVEGKQYSPANAQYGHDLSIKFDPNQKGQAMYAVDVPLNSGHTPLTPVEKAYPMYDVKSAYVNTGYKQADPDDLENFMRNVGLIPGARTGGGNGGGAATKLPTTPFSDDDLPESYGGTGAKSGGGFIPQQNFQPQGGFVPQQNFQPQGGFVPQQQGGFSPQNVGSPQGPSVPVTTTAPTQAPTMTVTNSAPVAGPSARFSAAPPETAPVPVTSLPVVSGNHPKCFRNEAEQGTPKCMNCASFDACMEE